MAVIGEIKEFRDLDIGQRFHMKGHGYIKHSSRTAKMLSSGTIVKITQKAEVCPFNQEFFK